MPGRVGSRAKALARALREQAAELEKDGEVVEEIDLREPTKRSRGTEIAGMSEPTAQKLIETNEALTAEIRKLTGTPAVASTPPAPTTPPATSTTPVVASTPSPDPAPLLPKKKSSIFGRG